MQAKKVSGKKKAAKKKPATKKKPAKKKPGMKKKGAKKKGTKKTAGPVGRKYAPLSLLLKRPKWLGKRVWGSGPKPPQGMGHIDRFYFSNCSESLEVLEIWGMVTPYAGGPLSTLSHGPVPPLTNGLVNLVMTLETIEVTISAIVDAGGTLYQYDYHCHIPQAYGEKINCIVVGIAQFTNGATWEVMPFGEIFGDQGTTYPLTAPDMIMTQLP